VSRLSIHHKPFVDWSKEFIMIVQKILNERALEEQRG